MSKHSPYQVKQLKHLGLDPDKITDVQRDIVLQPDEAPENYAHDGEYGEKENRRIWKQRMLETGFAPDQVNILERKIFL